LPPRARAEFREAVAAALAEVPTPSPQDDRRLKSLHRIWMDARRKAFDATISTFDDD
jgi:hypothetical protein